MGAERIHFYIINTGNIGDVAEWKINSVLEYFIDICVFCYFV